MGKQRDFTGRFFLYHHTKDKMLRKLYIIKISYLLFLVIFALEKIRFKVVKDEN
ncbi:MAG: hypothetical protein GY777_29790 [Candidatus Brocadiaceae bacterium]|nr:hypothetical protein [Candidatus Brocadiaceae bacterium]